LANCKPKITVAASRGFLATAWLSYCCRRRQGKGRKGKGRYHKKSQKGYISATQGRLSPPTPMTQNPASPPFPSFFPFPSLPSFLPFPNTLFLFPLPSSSLFPLPSLFPRREAAPCNRLGGLGSGLSPPAVSVAKPRPLMHSR